MYFMFYNIKSTITKNVKIIKINYLLLNLRELVVYMFLICISILV